MEEKKNVSDVSSAGREGYLMPDLTSKKNVELHPAMDFVGSTFFMGASIPYVASSGSRTNLPSIVTNWGEILPIEEAGKKNQWNFAEKSVKIESRWSFDSMEVFRTNNANVGSEAVFSEIRAKYNQFIEFSEDEAYDFYALWIMGTYVYQIFNSFPYVHLNGLKGTGKSKVLHLTGCLAFNSIFASNMTTSTIFRLIQQGRCTLLIDETEKLNDKTRAMDYRNILLNGYKKGAKAYRSEEIKGSFEPKAFETYSPKQLANINGLEDVLADRCIPIIMMRTMKRDIGNLEIDDINQTWQNTRDNLYVFAMKNWDRVKQVYESLENDTELNNRQWELWKPILSMAKLVGEETFNKIRGFAEKKAKETEMDNAVNSADYLLIETLSQIVTEDDFYPIKLIRDTMGINETAVWITSEWVGAALKRLGYTDKRRHKNGTEYRITPGSVKNLIERYCTGRDGSQPTLPTQLA